MAKAKKETTDGADLGELVMTPTLVSDEITYSSVVPNFYDSELKFYQARGKEIPEYATKWSAGFDLRADLEVGDKIMKYDHRNEKHEIKARDNGTFPPRLYLEAGDRVLVPTGLYADIPEGYYLAIHARSGTSWKQGLILTNGVGVVDSDYVEEIKVSITNVSGKRVCIEDGERIAQALLMPVAKARIEWLSKKPDQKTSRAGGFGSTGVK